MGEMTDTTLAAKLRDTVMQMAAEAAVDMRLWNEHSNAVLAAAGELETLQSRLATAEKERDEALTRDDPTFTWAFKIRAERAEAALADMRRALEGAEADITKRIRQGLHLEGMSAEEISSLVDTCPAIITIRAALSTPAEPASGDKLAKAVVPEGVAELVMAARVVAFEDHSPGALMRLDAASEAFADRVPWENEND